MGCQMNVLDSELVLGQLCALGYEPTHELASADLVLLNTCSVRQHAEDKVYSRLGEVGRAKAKHPEMLVGVIGCMAERDHEGLRRRARHVDRSFDRSDRLVSPQRQVDWTGRSRQDAGNDRL